LPPATGNDWVTRLERQGPQDPFARQRSAMTGFHDQDGFADIIFSSVGGNMNPGSMLTNAFGRSPRCRSAAA